MLHVYRLNKYYQQLNLVQEAKLCSLNLLIFYDGGCSI